MKYSCELIRDLLPLYKDNISSSESTKAVLEHLEECFNCRQYVDEMHVELSKSDIPIPDTETLEFIQIAKKMKRRNFIWKLCIVTFVICCFLYAIGGRLTSYQAAQASQWIDKRSILLGKEDFGSVQVFIYENEDKYRTIVSNYKFPFWKAGTSFWANKTDDAVKLIGWCSYGMKNKGVTVVPIQSFDDQVAYVEMGTGLDRIKKEIALNQVVIFSWEKSMPWNDLDGIAYSRDGEELYKLGYEIINSTIHTDELRWLPVEKDSEISEP